MNYQEILTIIALFFLFVAAISLTRYRRKYQATRDELVLLTRENKTLAEKCADLTTRISDKTTFASSLSDAEITTKLQSSRTHFHSPGPDSNPPEKYSYISALSNSGMPTEQIATLLSISLQETEQLVKLAHIGDK